MIDTSNSDKIEINTAEDQTMAHNSMDNGKSASDFVDSGIEIINNPEPSSAGTMSGVSTSGSGMSSSSMSSSMTSSSATSGVTTSSNGFSINSELKPKITVLGVGGAGGNAVNNMIRSQLEGVEFVVMNTDAQAITQSLAETRIQLGAKSTQGLGAGSKPEVGRAAAEESISAIEDAIEGSNMVFIAAGMGGGTGTGAASVVAKVAREKGVLTVGVVTKPFQFEGVHRMRAAEAGIEELQKHVDTLIVIPNQNLFRIANENTTFADAFKMADDVLYAGVRGITDLMIMPGLINLDFADVRSVMSEMGKAMMGTGEAEGEGRAIAAAEAAIANPLLDDVSMRGAKGVLISITGGMDMTLFEVDEAANRIRDEIESEANIIFGSTFDERLNGRLRVSVVATGIDAELAKKMSQSRDSSSSSLSFPSSSSSTPSFAVDSKSATMKGQADHESSPNGDESAKSTAGGVDPSLDVGIDFDSGTGDTNVTKGDAQPKTYDFFDDNMNHINNNVNQAANVASGGSHDELVSAGKMPRKKKKPGFFSRLFGLGDDEDSSLRSPAAHQVSIKVERGVTDLGKADELSSDGVDDDLDIPAYMRRLK